MRYTGISRPTIRKYLKRINNGSEDHTGAEISDDAALAKTAYNNDTTDLRGDRYAALVKHFICAEAELVKTGVTRQLLWLEYKEQSPDGYNYSQYCYYLYISTKRDNTICQSRQ